MIGDRVDAIDPENTATYFAVISDDLEEPSPQPRYLTKKNGKEYLRILYLKGSEERTLLIEVIEG